MVDEPNETSPGADGGVPRWAPGPAWDSQPMPPCKLCGAAFAAHVDGTCPQTWAYWAPPQGGPPFLPATVRPQRRWDDWLRRYPLLVPAILLIALLAGLGVRIGTVHEVSHQAAAPVNGNATACSYYWGITSATATTDILAQAGGWQALLDAAPGITDPALAQAVQAFDQDLYYADYADAVTGSIAIGKACTALGYGNPA